jgi:hypothetical protein
MSELPVKGWMTYSEAAKRLGFMPQTVRKYASQGMFDKKYVGKTPMVSVKSVEEFKRNRRGG